jgi:DNA-binding transcriptional ArsR family regulator
MRLIEGAVEPMSEDPRLSELEDEVRELRRELQSARSQVRTAQQDAARAVAALRKQLSPLYQALQMVFGEIDQFSTDDYTPSAGGTVEPRVRAVWDNWKSKLGSTAKLIDALLLHGEMNTQQLSVATGFHRTTIPAHIFKLNKNGLINKNGGKFSLKQL